MKPAAPRDWRLKNHSRSIPPSTIVPGQKVATGKKQNKGRTIVRSDGELVAKRTPQLSRQICLVAGGTKRKCGQPANNSYGKLKMRRGISFGREPSGVQNLFLYTSSGTKSLGCSPGTENSMARFQKHEVSMLTGDRMKTP